MRMSFAAIAALLLCEMAMPAHANTITVTNVNDNGPGSLRQALADASNGDTINFDASLKGQTITVTTAELVIDKSVTISGPGPNLLAVSRAENAPEFRIFRVVAADSCDPRSHNQQRLGFPIWLWRLDF
jgi:hypothetical protein